MIHLLHIILSTVYVTVAHVHSSIRKCEIAGYPKHLKFLNFNCFFFKFLVQNKVCLRVLILLMTL